MVKNRFVQKENVYSILLKYRKPLDCVARFIREEAKGKITQEETKLNR